jgi:dual specificity protein kinase YAK1
MVNYSKRGSYIYTRYLIMDILGSGTFGQVAKCKDTETDELVAVKVIKNKPAYTKQSLIEVDILQHVSQYQ